MQLKSIKRIACFPQFQWPSGQKFLRIINNHQIYVLRTFGGIRKAWQAIKNCYVYCSFIRISVPKWSNVLLQNKQTSNLCYEGFWRHYRQLGTIECIAGFSELQCPSGQKILFEVNGQQICFDFFWGNFIPYIGNVDMNKGVISDQKTKKAKKTKHFLEK